MARPLLLLVAALAFAGAAPARADTGVAQYALVVGANTGGPGQTPLRYAEDDARRMGALLVELGGYARDGVVVLAHPTPDQLRTQLAQLASRVQGDVNAGRQARLFFYYSGHARASELDLGAAAMPLGELRQRLFAVPATLTVVVLDACQSGAFSRIKGAEPAADFSFNSRQHLDASGVAVLASSSGSELSQESEQLRSSYFTHHLLIGMRGAGDANGDGQVSVDEAYRYAYHQTLLATSATAVGGQHVSLEVDLKGHGEVPLSFPRAATKFIELPASLEGQTLVHDKRAKAVVAETYKARGATVRIAVAPGEYEVLVREGNRVRRCQVGAGGAVDLDRCSSEAVAVATKKGGGFVRPMRIELFGMLGSEAKDEYVKTLRDSFGYYEQLGIAGGVGLSVVRQIHELAWVGGAVSYLAPPSWQFDGSPAALDFEWNTTSLLGLGRVQKTANPDAFIHLGGYAQLGAGLAIGRTRFVDQDGTATRQSFVGLALELGAGIYLEPRFLPGFAWSLGANVGWAPVIDNNIGQTHASGCNPYCVSSGLSYSY
jgi:hypothetical protein